MKLDKEPIYAHSTSPSRPDSHFFTYDSITVETAWKVNNDIMGEDKRKVVSEQKQDNKTDSLLTQEKLGEVRNVPRLHSLVNVENSINVEGKELEDPYYSDSDKESEKETKYYTDKNVTELELPELMVCFQEFEDGDYHAVKDICIDDGFHSLNKKLVENDGICSKGVFSSMQEELNLNNDLTKENVKNASPISNATNPFDECDLKTDDANTLGAEILKGNGEEVDNVASILNRTNPFAESDRKTDAANKLGSETSSGNCEEDFGETVNLVDSVACRFSVTNPFVECDGKTDLNNMFESDSSTENELKDLIESVDTESHFVGTNPFLECDSEADDAMTPGSENLTVNVLEESEEIVNVVSDEKAIPETIPFVEEFVASDSPKSSNSNIYEQQQSDQDTLQEADSVDHMMHSAEESNNCNQENETKGSDQAKSESMTDDVDSSLAATSAREEDPPETTDCRQSMEPSILPIIEATSGREEDPPEATDYRQSVESSILPIIEEETADIRTASDRSLFIQHGFGETSFSAAGLLSGPLVNSGRMPYSGSISLRSDSSTTSTRSFAFPILNTEWNSSPVKMEKADRRHFRKHRGWRGSLLCCRF